MFGHPQFFWMRPKFVFCWWEFRHFEWIPRSRFAWRVPVVGPRLCECWGGSAGCIQDGDTVIYLLVSMHLRNRETTTSFAVSNRFSYKKNENTIMNICLKMLNTVFNIYLTISTHPQIIGTKSSNCPTKTHPTQPYTQGARPYLPWRCDCHSAGSAVPSPSSPSLLRALQAWRRRFLRRTEVAPGHHTTRPSPIRRWPR